MKEESRQVKWRKEMIAKGLCPQCARKARKYYVHCKECAEKQRKKSLERYWRLKGKKP